MPFEDAQLTGQFFSLTPDRVLTAVEQAGYITTGLCYPLNSLENRVYEVELDDSRRVIAKFYRPGRWSREAILDEHRMLAALNEHEIPVCPPIPFEPGDTLRTTPEGIFFALFPKTGGRAPEDLGQEQLSQLGRLLARIHNVSSSLDLQHRPEISPQTYGLNRLAVILEHTNMPAGLQARYRDAVHRVVDMMLPRFDGIETLVVHGDCHRGNLLFGQAGWFFLDFDDMGRAPPVQDLWLLLPGRRAEVQPEIDAMLRGYEAFRAFDHRSLRLIEPLRALRYIRYAAWVAERWEDPSFPRAFPDWGTEAYWEGQVADLYEQLRVMQEEDQAAPWH